MEVDYKAAAFYLDVAQWLSIGVVAIWGYLRTKDNDNARAVEQVAADLGGAIEKVAADLGRFARACGDQDHAQSLRLTTVEERLKHVPTSDELAQIEGNVSEVRAKVDGIDDLLRRVEHQTNLIHQHLLNGR